MIIFKQKEEIWRHTFIKELGVISEEATVLMTEPPLNPRANREKIMQIMFEQFDVAAFYLAIDALLALYGSGRTTGLVISSGEGVTHTVPIYEGYAFPDAIKKLDIGGRQITDYLQKLLVDTMDNKDHFLWANFDIINTMKEKLCYVALDYDADMEKAKVSIELQKNYKLPDGKIIQVETERVQAPEIMFNPELIGLESDGLHQLLYDSIIKCNHDIRNDLSSNILLCGGNTMFDGFDERLLKELKKLIDYDGIRIIGTTDARYAAWIGGMVATSLSTFMENWISKDEYDESGPAIINPQYVSCLKCI